MFILHSISAHARSFVGQWTTQEGNCSNSDDEYRIKIKTGSIDFYESSCTFVSGKDSGTTRIIKSKCSGEGQEWNSEIRITPSGENIILSDENSKTVYHRCSAAASEPSDVSTSDSDTTQTHITNPSFNCSQAKKSDEIAICENDALAANDLIMNDEYIRMKERLGKAESNKIAKAYLKRRRLCASDINCISQIQSEAIATFRSQGTQNSTDNNYIAPDVATSSSSTETSDTFRTTLKSSFETIDKIQKSSGYDPFVFYLGSGLLLFGSIGYLFYRWKNTETCPNCGTTNWHSNAEQSDLLDRKMRMGTYDRTTYYDGYTQHNPTNYLYYDEVYRFHMKCKSCGHRWQVVRKKRG